LLSDLAIVYFKSDWMVIPDGKIENTTPYASKPKEKNNINEVE